MARPCPNIAGLSQGSTILAQQLFLGASINSFNSNIGWGGSASSLNVEVVNDFGSFGKCFIDQNPSLNIFNIKNPGKYDIDNHYYDCSGDSCYVDENGNDFNPDGRPPSQERRIPGKVYHILGSNGLVSRYWRGHDPGFFGSGTLLNPGGVFRPRFVTGDSGQREVLPYRYNIIGIPAYFRYGAFTFGGIIKSWDTPTRGVLSQRRRNRRGPPTRRDTEVGSGTFTVSLTSADEILNNSYIILDKYAGSIFSNFTSFGNFTSIGGPTNYTGNMASYIGNLKQGNIPNVFNIYGFLESYGFGVSEKNDQGIPVEYIIRALSVLTSASNKNLGQKAAFSPFGRIILPIPLTDAVDDRDEYFQKPTNAIFGNNSFGLCDIQKDVAGIPRCEFALDISELPIPPRNIKLDTSSDSMSITDFIRQVCDKTGRDFYTTMIRKNGLNLIKIKTIDRTRPVPTNSVSKIIDDLEDANIPTTATNVGQEQNQATPKVLYIGANQQRLYQTKSYTLGYSQSNYIYHPTLKKFIVLNDIGSVKDPAPFSTRNLGLSERILGKKISDIFSREQRVLGQNPDSIDIDFMDTEVGGSTRPIIGNYEPTKKYNDNSFVGKTRFIPLLKNSICPFFGYKYNEKVNIDTSPGSNVYRFIRPVYYDTWTGQLTIGISLEELPVLSIGAMPSVYSARATINQPTEPGGGLQASNPSQSLSSQTSTQTPPEGGQVKYDGDKDTPVTSPLVSTKPNQIGLTISESEMRAAMVGWESYLAYCLAKMSFSKPDLFTMLVVIYASLGKIFGAPVPPIDHGPGGGLLGATQDLSSSNVSGGSKQNTGVATAAYKQLNINFNLFLNHEFIKDFKILTSFIADIGNTFYGKKYLVRLPEVRSYRDSQNPDIKIPAAGSQIAVYQGSGKIFFNYEIANGAWEEPGNFIDGEIVVGSPNYYKLIDENNLIKPLVAYNASYNRDVVTEAWCRFEQNEKRRLLGLLRNPPPSNPTVPVPPRGTSEIPQTGQPGQQPGQPGGSLGPEDQPQFGVVSFTSQNQTAPSGSSTEDSSPTRPQPTIPSNQANIIAQLNKYGWNIENCGTKVIPSLNLSNVADYVLTQVPGVAKDAFGDTVPGVAREKLYLSANIESQFAFLDPINLIGPMAIVDVGAGIDLYSSSFSYTADPNLTVISNASMEDLAILESSEGASFGPKKKQDRDKLKDILKANIVPIDHLGFLIKEGDTSNQSSKHATIAPKKAHPIFAGIPLRSNMFCYGPWTNYPSLADPAILFPEIERTTDLLEQMIGGAKIQKNDDWAPWNYGGMAFLDQVIINDILTNVSYQTKLEQGSLSIASLPLFGLAGNMTVGVTDNDWHRLETGTFLGFKYNYLVYPFNNPSKINNLSYNGITISNININVSNNNLSTTYSFRTYSPKLGLFNKENSDRIKEFSNSRLSLAKKIADVSKNFENSIRRQIGSIVESAKTNRQSTNLGSFESKIYASSPTQMLIGSSAYYIPSEPNVISSTGISNSWAGMFVPSEAVAELSKQYNAKAVMSFDGLFSPVSLYPTENNSTFAISSRAVIPSLTSRKIVCPKCGGKGVIKDIILKGDKSTEIDFPCPLCAKSKILPIKNERDEDEDINFNSLNPICLPTGEFRNNNAQDKDFCRYNIRNVGRSDVPPTGTTSLDSFININDPKIADINFGEVDTSYKNLFGENILNNHRFFAFRGPMMLHGWGFDTDGFPVPNEADEPREYDNEGRPKRFFLDNFGVNDLKKDGAFLPQGNQQLGDIIGKGWVKEGGEWVRKPTDKFYLDWSERPDIWPIGPIDLRWDYERKVWTGGGGGGCNNADPPYIVAIGTDTELLSNFISLSNRKNKKCSYKMVYGILEHDMNKAEGSLETYPTRAFLDDLEYGLEPLPENVRRLIYIVDRTGYTAPRGAKLLLRYNVDSGFYEPVSKQQYITFGLINGSSSATIELDYLPGYKAGNFNTKTTIVFSNPLGLKAGKKGLFVYNNKWDLLNTD